MQEGLSCQNACEEQQKFKDANQGILTLFTESPDSILNVGGPANVKTLEAGVCLAELSPNSKLYWFKLTAFGGAFATKLKWGAIGRNLNGFLKTVDEFLPWEVPPNRGLNTRLGGGSRYCSGFSRSPIGRLWGLLMPGFSTGSRLAPRAGTTNWLFPGC